MESKVIPTDFGKLVLDEMPGGAIVTTADGADLGFGFIIPRKGVNLRTGHNFITRSWLLIFFDSIELIRFSKAL